MEPKRDIRIGDTILRKQPPVVGTFCHPPSSKNAWDPHCVYRSAACGGEFRTCPTCAFPFCAEHYPKHVRRFECPVDVWKGFDERRRAWYDRVKAQPMAKPKVHVEFPEKAPEDEA